MNQEDCLLTGLLGLGSQEEPGGAGCFWSRSRLKKKPGAGAKAVAALEKKSGAAARATYKLFGSSALMEDKKHKEIVLLLLFFK